ncbi:MAG TPA: putative sulfate exporter family transporter [Acidimicrobiales bacterium]|nr:putative sulfate exporter family transporter [Acidimicrobiales bacterium]
MPAVHDVEINARSGPAVGLSSLPVARMPVVGLRALMPGVVFVSALAGLATVLGGLAPMLGAPVIAIVCGIIISLGKKPSMQFRPGIMLTSKKVLQGSVILLGTGLSLGQVLATGGRSLPVLVGTLLAALAMAWLAGRLLGLRGDVSTLVGVGTAICGASAIAATNAVIDADEPDVSYAIATIFTFNVVAVLLYPSLGHALGLSPHSFGLWAGTAINDLSSVVAATTVYGHAAASYGVVVKLTRALAIIPICLGLAAIRGRRAPGAVAAAPGDRAPLRRIVPLFIPLFVAAVVANTLGLVPAGWHHPLSDLSTWMITAALAAVGLSTDVRQIRQAGLRPLALGAVLWLTVGLASLGLQAATGAL